MTSVETILAKLEAAGDRVQEAHFFLHGMERAYHFAEPFRWNLNAFLRPLKEVPQLVSVAVQNDPAIVAWHKERRWELRRDPLVHYLAEQRDFVAHQGTLIPGSSAVIGITEGRAMKMGLGHPVDPRLDSDRAMERFAQITLAQGDFLQILTLDDEDSLPAIERKWILDPFPDTELVDLCAEAWLKVAAYISDVLKRIEQPIAPPDLSCRHGFGGFRIRAYSRVGLRRKEILPISI